MTAEATMAPGPQHMEALRRANAVRLARAALKRRVGVGEMTAADVILASPWEAVSMTVGDLLTSQRRWGHTRARKFLQAVPMSENKPIGSMTDRQRRALATMLADGGAERPTGARRREALQPALAAIA